VIVIKDEPSFAKLGIELNVRVVYREIPLAPVNALPVVDGAPGISRKGCHEALLPGFMLPEPLRLAILPWLPLLAFAWLPARTRTKEEGLLLFQLGRIVALFLEQKRPVRFTMRAVDIFRRAHIGLPSFSGKPR
jgi:hypothetical protein